MSPGLLLSLLVYGFLVYHIPSIGAALTLPAHSYGSVQSVDFFVQDEISDSQPSINTSSTTPNSILFVGDVLLARNVEYLMNKHGDDYPYSGFDFSSLSDSQFVVGNFEATVPAIHKITEAQKLNFSVDSRYLPALKEAGFTHFSLANNHSYDFGDKGSINTSKQLSEHGLNSFGNAVLVTDSSVSFVEVGEYKVSLIALQTVTITPTDEELTLVLGAATSNSDIQVVYIHWGDEYQIKSNAKQQLLAKRLVELGADLIIGHHPHVVQEIGFVDGVPVFYSLGNYIFDQYFSSEVQEGLVVSFDLEHVPAIYFYGVTSSATLSQPRRMGRAEEDRLLERIAKTSDVVVHKYIALGRIPLDIVVATSSKMAIMKP